MAFESKVEPALGDAIRVATEAINAWRGRCVNQFGKAEKLLSTLMLSIDPNKTPPMLISKKVEQLEKMTECDELIAALRDFAPLLKDRTALTHGSGKLWVAEKGRWQVTLDWVSGKEAQRRVFTDEEMDKFHSDLRIKVQQLERAARLVG